MKNLPLVIGLLSTIILSLYCIDFHTKPILNLLNHQVVSETIKTKNYVEVVAKPIKYQTVEKSKDAPILKKIVPKKESELDILKKKILEDMKKNKDNRWRQ